MCPYRSSEQRKEYVHEWYRKRRAELESAKPADPIALLTPEQRAYIAGLVDGEGAVYVGVIGPKPHKTVYPIISIAMTDQATVEWVAQQLGCKAIVRSKPSATNPPITFRTQWAVKISGRRAQLLCEVMLPYLITKRRHAVLIMEFPCDCRTAPGIRMKAAINDIRFAIREQVNSMNISGVRRIKRIPVPSDAEDSA